MKKDKIDWKLLAGCFLVVFAIALFGSFFTKIDSWYETVKPAITPPSYVFPIVWTILFFMIAISMYFALNYSSDKQKKVVGILFFVNLALNTFWSFLFFTFHNPLFAILDLILLWISILCLIIYLRKISLTASILLIPYLLWVSFAGYLNYIIAF